MSLGMDVLQGYVEWHIANTLQMIALANKVGQVDTVVVCFTILFLIAGEVSRNGTLGCDSSTDWYSSQVCVNPIMHIVNLGSAFLPLW